MRILVCSLNFSPELTGIGKYSGEMVEWLLKNNFDVRVVSAPPYYPDWKVWGGFSSKRYIKEPFGASVDSYIVRCPLWVPSRPSGMKRILHLMTFALSSFPALIGNVFWRPDVVWVVAPAFFTAPAALVVAKLSGASSWLHVQDYEVDAAFEMGFLKGGFLRSLVTKVERFIFGQFDVVSSISSRMIDKALQKGVLSSKTVFFPNWVDVSAISPVPDLGRYRDLLGIPADAVVALYSGNMGGKQGLEILADAAELLSEHEHIYFVFCGNGAGRAELEMRCEGLAQVRFMDLQPLERLGELLTMADIHLLPQRADAADLVMPSKLTGMLASGRPVVATAHLGTELSNVLEARGLVVPPEDAQEFATGIRRLVEDESLRLKLGSEARRYAENYLDKDAVLKRFASSLQALCS